MKVLWLSTYPEKLLRPELKTLRHKETHYASWIVNLAKLLSNQHGIEFHILTTSSNISKSQHFLKNNIHFHVIKYTLPIINRGFPDYLPYDSLTWYSGFRRRAKKIIKRIKPDLIHAHGIEKGFALLASELHFKSIVSIQGILTEIYKTEPSLKALFQIPIEKYAVKRLTYFGCRTTLDSNFVSTINSNAKILYLPEVINDVFFEAKWQPDNEFTITYVGGIIKRKGVELLLNALPKIKQEFPQIVIQYIGGSSEKYITNLLSKIELNELKENVRFLGTKSSDEIAQILKKSTAFILPSYTDNSPNSLAEAMAIGMPCLASNAGGIPSMITHEKNGLLFKKGDINSLINVVLKLLGDVQLRNELASQAKKTAYDRNYKDVVISQTLKVYKEVLESNI